MTRYPLRYFSESKKSEVDIESMASPHIANAWRKLVERMVPGPEEGLEARVEARMAIIFAASFEQELRARGCTLDAETRQWTFPPKPEVAP